MHNSAQKFTKVRENTSMIKRAYTSSSATTNLTLPDMSLLKSILAQAICTTTRINHRKEVTRFHYGTYNPPVSFESRPLCSSRKVRIARLPGQVALPQSMHRVVTKIPLKHAK
jgi:hypothetical protein